MRAIILIALFFAVATKFNPNLIGGCGQAPKNRPIGCYTDKVLQEDIPELKRLLRQFKKTGDDNVFADYLYDMFEKKKFREGKEKNEPQPATQIGNCGMHPKYLGFECYEPQVLRRHRTELKNAYDNLHATKLEDFNKVLIELREKKVNYYEGKSE